MRTARRIGDSERVAISAVRDEPLRESAHRAVIRVCLAEGNRADFTVQNTKEIANALGSVMGILTLLLSSIAAISLSESGSE